jgi:hypothetical protein
VCVCVCMYVCVVCRERLSGFGLPFSLSDSLSPSAPRPSLCQLFAFFQAYLLSLLAFFPFFCLCFDVFAFPPTPTEQCPQQQVHSYVALYSNNTHPDMISSLLARVGARRSLSTLSVPLTVPHRRPPPPPHDLDGDHLFHLGYASMLQSVRASSAIGIVHPQRHYRPRTDTATPVGALRRSSPASLGTAWNPAHCSASQSSPVHPQPYLFTSARASQSTRASSLLSSSCPFSMGSAATRLYCTPAQVGILVCAACCAQHLHRLSECLTSRCEIH